MCMHEKRRARGPLCFVVTGNKFVPCGNEEAREVVRLPPRSRIVTSERILKSGVLRIDAYTVMLNAIDKEGAVYSSHVP